MGKCLSRIHIREKDELNEIWMDKFCWGGNRASDDGAEYYLRKKK